MASEPEPKSEPEGEIEPIQEPGITNISSAPEPESEIPSENEMILFITIYSLYIVAIVAGNLCIVVTILRKKTELLTNKPIFGVFSLC